MSDEPFLFRPRSLAARAANGYDFRPVVCARPHLILCDGCGQPASPEHIRERVARLEVATRFRPIHVSVLFLVPSAAEFDFYDAAPRPPGARESLLDALDIVAPAQIAAAADRSPASETELRLADFQRRGFYFASVSECALPESDAPALAVERLAPTLLKRIQFSYKPKAVVLLSPALATLLPLLAATGQGISVLPDGAPLAWPGPADPAAEAAFRAACAHIAQSART